MPDQTPLDKQTPLDLARRGFPGAVVGAVILGAAQTAGDWIWARYLTDGAVLPGLVHGVVFFALLAVVLSLPCPDPRAALKLLAKTLPPSGLALAAVFYPLAYALGYLAALLVTWTGMWICLATLLRIAAGRDESTLRSLARAVLAAAGSGLAFWAVSDLWTAAGADFGLLDRLWRWIAAFLPGLAALFCCRTTWHRSETDPAPDAA